MAKTKSIDTNDYEAPSLPFSKKPRNRAVNDGIISIVLFLIGIFILLAAFDAAGNAGKIFFGLLAKIFGFIAYFVWIVFFILGYRY